MRMYPVELPPVRRKKLNFRDHARRSWAMTATRPPAEPSTPPTLAQAAPTQGLSIIHCLSRFPARGGQFWQWSL